MMQIGFYIECIPDIDCSHPDRGNPGMGGTQYCMITLIHYLKIWNKDIGINVYCEHEALLPHNISPIIVKDGTDAVKTSKDRGDDYLIIKNPAQESSLYEVLCRCNHNIIVWCHNYILSDYADYLAISSNIVAVVFVGKQLYDRYIDHDIINKSIYIYNIVPDPVHWNVNRSLKKSVVYLGAIINIKGFHLLASIWKDIIKEVPEAELHVIGSGRVYSRHAKLGKFGIADESYEEKFMPLLMENDAVMPSVHFHGIVGAEKYDIFSDAMVGVVNPSGRTETFGMGIIEMNSSCLPVVTINRNGYPDTISNGVNGFLGNSLNDIKTKIVDLLIDEELNLCIGKTAKESVKRFSAENIMPMWIELFDNLSNGRSLQFQNATRPYTNNSKWLRIINRFLRYSLHLKFIPSIISIETKIYKIVKG